MGALTSIVRLADVWQSSVRLAVLRYEPGHWSDFAIAMASRLDCPSGSVDDAERVLSVLEYEYRLALARV